MLQTIQGIYRNGKIELLETPQGITESQVVVTFLPAQPSNATHDTITALTARRRPQKCCFRPERSPNSFNPAMP